MLLLILFVKIEKHKQIVGPQCCLKESREILNHIIFEDVQNSKKTNIYFQLEEKEKVKTILKRTTGASEAQCVFMKYSSSCSQTLALPSPTGSESKTIALLFVRNR